MALGSMERETWEDFLEAVWQLHIEASNHWIPVEERLPEEGQVVFIYTKHGSVSAVTYKDGAFNLNEVLEAINITHWMEIVPPRKEVEK